MKNHKIPDSVYQIVLAEFADYDRKKALLNLYGENMLSKEQRIAFFRVTNIIDEVIDDVCAGEDRAAKQALKRDISEGRGFDRSYAKVFYPAKETFKRRKRNIIKGVAHRLGLLV